jgi:cytoskeletal protein CcmA (bactofilin family)
MFRRSKNDHTPDDDDTTRRDLWLDDDELPPITPLRRPPRELPVEPPAAEPPRPKPLGRAGADSGAPQASPKQPAAVAERLGPGAPRRPATGERPLATPERTSDVPEWPRDAPEPRVDQPRGSLPARPTRSNVDDDARKLIVGREIRLTGEISCCAHLVVEGMVQANLADSRLIEVAANGSYRGKAEVDDADIAGAFDGELVVRNLLLIRGTGRVNGTVRYRQLQVECGGGLTGEIRHEDSAPAETTPPRLLDPPAPPKGRQTREEATASVIARSQELAGNDAPRPPRRAG